MKGYYGLYFALRFDRQKGDAKAIKDALRDSATADNTYVNRTDFYWETEEGHRLYFDFRWSEERQDVFYISFRNKKKAIEDPSYAMQLIFQALLKVLPKQPEAARAAYESWDESGTFHQVKLEGVQELPRREFDWW